MLFVERNKRSVRGNSTLYILNRSSAPFLLDRNKTKWKKQLTLKYYKAKNRIILHINKSYKIVSHIYVTMEVITNNRKK